MCPLPRLRTTQATLMGQFDGYERLAYATYMSGMKDLHRAAQAFLASPSPKRRERLDEERDWFRSKHPVVLYVHNQIDPDLIEETLDRIAQGEPPPALQATGLKGFHGESFA